MADESTPLKRKSDILEKTPVAVLTELCVADGEVPMFEDVPHENPKMFACIVRAFGISDIGSGRSKKEAKHEASAAIIAQLAQLKRFKEKLPSVPRIPHPTSDKDAVGTLLDICIQRNWPLAQFQEIQACGEPHRPVFTFLCTLSSIKRSGTFSTKKGAKQFAARAMLEVVQSFKQNEELAQVATVESEPPEKLFCTYREFKDSGVKRPDVRLRSRHNYLLHLPEEDRNEAIKILMDDSFIYGTSKDKVHLVCEALKLKYDVKDIPDHRQLHKVFFLKGTHDCVLSEHETRLYDRVIEHFKLMLNLVTPCYG